VQTVTIGRLHHQIIRVVSRNRGAQDGVQRAAHIAGKNDFATLAPLLGFEVEKTGSQDVAGVPVLSPHTGNRAKMLPVIHRVQQRQHRAGILLGKERPCRAMLGVPFFVGPAGLLLLQMAGVREEDPREVGGGPCAVDRPPETFLYQARQKSNMVNVRMGQQHRIDRVRLNRERIPVLQPVLLGTLKKPAVDQDPVVVAFQEVAASGDGAGGTQKCQANHPDFIQVA